MSSLEAQVAGVTSPVPSVTSAPYWEGCRAGELRYQRCPACGAVPATPSARCPRCLRPAPTWLASDGRGSLYSWTVVWRPPDPALRVPYAPAIVELGEGFRLLSAVVGCDHEDLVADMRLEVEFHRLDEVITLPFFRPGH